MRAVLCLEQHQVRRDGLPDISGREEACRGTESSALNLQVHLVVKWTPRLHPGRHRSGANSGVSSSNSMEGKVEPEFVCCAAHNDPLCCSVTSIQSHFKRKSNSSSPATEDARDSTKKKHVRLLRCFRMGVSREGIRRQSEFHPREISSSIRNADIRHKASASEHTSVSLRGISTEVAPSSDASVSQSSAASKTISPTARREGERIFETERHSKCSSSRPLHCEPLSQRSGGPQRLCSVHVAAFGP